jgi:hypothetical protein
MNLKTKMIPLAFAATLAFGPSLFAQTSKVDFPAPSPACTIKQRVGLTDIEVVYSRPSMKGRKIFGADGLVPFDKVWRTGANSATKITFSTPVKLNDADVPAGTYALFTIPGEFAWTIIISKGSGQWGAYQYNEKDDLVRFKAKPAQLAEHIETFTIEFNQLRDESATLELVWDNVAVPIKIERDLTATLVPQIQAVMASEEKNKPYYQAAMFYYDHGQDLEQAKQWVNAAIAQREAHYIVFLKAKILAKLGDKAGAIAAANRSIELAKAAKDTGYVKMNEDLIASLK